MLDVGVSVKGSQNDNLNVSVAAQNKDGSVSLNKSAKYDNSLPWNDIDIDLRNVPPGSYQVTSRVVNTLSQIWTPSDSTMTLTIASPDLAMPKVHIDEYNRTVKDGQLFFPLGYYTHTYDSSIMDKIVATGFNTMMSYDLLGVLAENIDATLKDASAHNINVIFSLKDTYDGSKYATTQWKDADGVIHKGGFDIFQAMVKSYKDTRKYPSILAWYIDDEMDTPWLPEIQKRYHRLLDNDPYHPAWQVLYKGENITAHVDNSDILGIDNYPVWSQQTGGTSAPLYNSFSGATRTVTNATMNSRGIWMVPECKVDNGSRPDTYDEMINYAYQSLINGARGLIYYNLDDLLADADYKAQSDQSLATMKKVGDHLNAIMPIALGIDADPDHSLTSSEPKIEILTRVVGNDLYALAVNPYNSAVSASFNAGSGILAKYITVGLPGSSERTINVTDNEFSDEFGPLETRIYKINTE